MNRDKWLKLQDLFSQAVSMPHSDRDAFIVESCDKDNEMVAQLRRMLAADQDPLTIFGKSDVMGDVSTPNSKSAERSVDQFEIVGEIGSGGMGSVYLALDTILDRMVALKFLPPALTMSAPLRARFLREARSAAALSHPNVVTIYQISQDGSNPYIAMEFVSGRCLKEIMADGPVSGEKAILIVSQICLGLEAAHAQGVVHRDIKPGNIMVTDGGLVKILDFGIARAGTDESLTLTGNAIGTANYMSPEQACGQHVDARSDIFSVGILLYEMITGKKPFKRNNIAATVDAIIHDPYERIDGHGDVLLVAMSGIVDRALEKKVEARYQTVTEMHDDLQQLQPIVTGVHSRKQPAISSGPLPPAIAVLKLRGQGGDEEHWSYGLTEDLVVELSRLGLFRVASLRSTLKFADSDGSVREIGRELGVAYILDGSIKLEEGNLRLVIELIDVESQETIWSDLWTKPLGKVRAVERSVIKGVTQALGYDYAAGLLEVKHEPSHSPEAYEFYLRGKYLFDHKKDTADISIASSMFKKALDLESTLISARVGVAEVAMHQGALEEARSVLEKLLEESEDHGEQHERAVAMRLLSAVYGKQGQWQMAMRQAKAALEILREYGDVEAEARVLGDMISYLVPQAEYDEALTLLDRVLEINSRLNDEQKVAEALKNIGKLYRQKADYTRAASYYTQALRLARAHGDLSLESACLGNLGNVHLCTDRTEDALACYQAAMDIDTRLNKKGAVLNWTHNMGSIFFKKGNFDKAVEHYERAYLIARDIGDQKGVAHVRCSLSEVLVDKGEFGRAVEAAKEALSIAESLNYVSVISRASYELGAAVFHEGNSELARFYFTKALGIAKGSDLGQGECWILVMLAQLSAFENNYSDCGKYAERAANIAQENAETAAQRIGLSYLALARIVENGDRDSLAELRQIAAQSDTGDDIREMLAVRRILGWALAVCDWGDEFVAEGLGVLQSVISNAVEKRHAAEQRLTEILLQRYKRDS